MKEIANIKSVTWVKFTVYGLLLIGIFYSAYQVMLKWWRGDDFNYCYLIAPIVLYLIWEKRERLASVPSQPAWHGLLPLILGLALFWFGELGGEYFTLYFSSWLLLVGLLWLHLGWKKLKKISFPLAILLGMFPLPNFLHGKLSFNLKLLSSQLGVKLIQWIGLSAYREGNVIDLGFTRLQVVDACSGLRYLFPLLMTGILLAYWFQSSLWKKIVLVLSTIPLTIITNSMRIAMTGILYKVWGSDVAEGFFHGFSGWFIFMFALSIMLMEMWVLSGFRSFRTFRALGSDEGLGSKGLRIKDEGLGNLGRKKFRDCVGNSGIRGFWNLGIKDKEIEGLRIPNSGLNNSYNPTNSTNPKNPTNLTNPTNATNLTNQTNYTKKSWLKAFFSPPQFVVAVLLLGATLALSQLVEFREKIPMSRSFAGFPMQIGEWSGRREVMEPKLVNALDLSDYVIVDYVGSSGKSVNFYTAYYESQCKGESIHSPETCLPGGGWEIKKNSIKTVPLEHHNQANIRVNRAFMVKGDTHQLTYFWFPARGRILTNAYQLKLYTFWDALTKQRTDGALVRLVTPVYNDENVKDADARLVAFTREIVPVLDGFLPK